MSWVQAALVCVVSRWKGSSTPAGELDGVAGIGLIEGGARIGESADASVAAEVVIEGAILLDEDDDVIDVGDLGAGGGPGGIGESHVAGASVEQGAGKACCSCGGRDLQ